jgi:GNAT superfamily N-acetyltransferase
MRPEGRLEGSAASLIRKIVRPIMGGELMDASIRMATWDDASDLAGLRWQSRLEGGEEPVVSLDGFITSYVEFFRHGLETNTRAHFAADIGSRIVSHLTVQRVSMVPRPCKLKDEWGYVTDNYTSPGFRNQGIGSAVLQEAITWSRDQDLELLIVWPSEEAKPHYERAGFTVENEIMERSLREYYSPNWVSEPTPRR